jgi:predicted transport protein
VIILRKKNEIVLRERVSISLRTISDASEKEESTNDSSKRLLSISSDIHHRNNDVRKLAIAFEIRNKQFSDINIEREARHLSIQSDLKKHIESHATSHFDQLMRDSTKLTRDLASIN